MRIRTKQELLNELKFKTIMVDLKTNPSIKEINLDGRKVKLDKAKYERQILNNELSEDFIEFYKNNCDNTFIAKKTDIKSIYDLEGVDIWRFSEFQLLTECEHCGEFVYRSLYYCSKCNRSYLEKE